MVIALKSELEQQPDVNPAPAPIPNPAPPAPGVPPAPEPTPPPASPETAEQKAYRLEIENAELRGKTSVLEKQPEPKPAAPEPIPRSQREIQWDQTKVIVNGHINTMSDDDFESRYNYKKAEAQNQIVQGDNQLINEKTIERTTKMEAENKLYAKYGNDYGEVSDEMNRILMDAAPEVKSNPTRLTSYLERQFKAIRKPKKDPAPSPASPPTGDPMNKRITNFDIHAPIPAPPNPNAAPKETPIDPSIAHIINAFGTQSSDDRITSEEERKQYESPNIRMDLGKTGGKRVVFRDPKKGFERI